MLDVVGEYNVPDEVSEWLWVERNACYEHNKNGESGIWDFVINLSSEFKDVPERLKAIIDGAQKNGTAYILFHQGT